MLNNENFTKAIQHYKNLGIKYQLKDHSCFQSLYTKDPDKHSVELTTLMVDEKDFY